MCSVAVTSREAAKPADVWAVAAALAGQPIHAGRPVSGGGNSRIYKVVGEHAVYALKAYPHGASDSRDRLGTEYAALTLLAQRGVEAVPRPIAADRECGYGLYEWLESEAVGMASAADIDECVAMIARLRDIGRCGVGTEIGAASAACWSGAAVVAQLEERFLGLRREAARSADLEWFLDRELAPAVAATVKEATNRYALAELRFDQPLDLPELVLSPSDFGFHNAGRRCDGALQFFDFEYFGWDDPAKLMADFLLHPGMKLTPELKQRSHAGARIALCGDAAFDAASPRSTRCSACAGA